jgi:diguanylate cyclase (GGDEF)-like protein
VTRSGVRFGVFAKLTLLMGGLAAVSTILALVIQDRTLSADLREAASVRLARAAGAAQRMIDDHLAGVVQRYVAISATPEFRANLDAGDRPTLTYHAQSLVERLGASTIAFQSPEGELEALAGDEGLLLLDAERVRAGTPTYLTAGDRIYAAAAIPLRIRADLVGYLVAVEVVGPEVLEAWSSVLGVLVTVGAAEPSLEDALVRTVNVTGASVLVSTTYEAERQAIARARQRLVLAGVAALLLAVLAGAFLARSFARPIRRLKLAAERVGGEMVDVHFDVERRDEIGDLGRAFGDMLARLRESETRLARAQRLARFSNWSFDPSTNAVDAGPDFHRLFELEQGGALKVHDLLECIHPDDRDKFAAAVERVRIPNGAFRTDVRLSLRRGRDRILHLRGQHRGSDGQPSRVEASAQDVTERWNSARQIEYLSLHDSVTGLGNRRYLFERLGMQLKQAERDEAMVVLLLIGLEGFASIEGTMGHQVGDELLSEVAKRVVATIGVPRQPDRRRRREPTSYSAVRFGNDEFAAVDNVMNRDEAAELAGSVARALREPYVIDGQEISVTVSIGISVFPDDATTVDALVRYGKTALQTGRSISEPFHFYDEAMHQRQVRRLRVASLLRRAIEREELELHYQPRVRPDSGKIVAVEALARWTHDELGPVSPGEFVPIAEDVGLVQALGDWCLRVAVRDLLRWQSLGITEVRISVNLSPQQILPGLVERVLDITTEVDPHSIEFEVTESAVLRNPDQALALLNRLSDHGFRIALDDFGTGYSSLSHVRQLPLDAVKVDRSFIKDLATNDEALSITGAVIMMCQAMKLESVGEGVETEEQFHRLVELGCDEVQGHLFAAAMPATDLVTLLEAPRAAFAPPAPRRRRTRTRR